VTSSAVTSSAVTSSALASPTSSSSASHSLSCAASASTFSTGAGGSVEAVRTRLQAAGQAFPRTLSPHRPPQARIHTHLTSCGASGETMHATPPIRLPSVICFSALHPVSRSSDAVRLITSAREMQLLSPATGSAWGLEARSRRPCVGP
jgi:hypothetical protein